MKMKTAVITKKVMDCDTLTPTNYFGMMIDDFSETPHFLDSELEHQNSKYIEERQNFINKYSISILESILQKGWLDKFVRHYYYIKHYDPILGRDYEQVTRIYGETTSGYYWTMTVYVDEEKSKEGVVAEYQCNGDVWEAIWSYSRLKEAVGVFIEKIEE